MKSIKKMTKAVAGSALLIGATLAGGAAMGAAQDSGSSGMTLGDYPAPFVDDDGEVDTTVVVGESAKTVDVVGGVNIAGSLGNAAFDEEAVSAGGGSGSWAATNGVTLDTTNDNVYFGEDINTVRNVLTSSDLDVLQTVEVLDGDEEQDVEQYLYVGDQAVDYSNPSDEDQNPFLNVANPAEPTSTNAGDYLYRLQANFQDGVQFANDAGDDRNDDVYGEEVTMFGMDYTVADSSFSGDGQLVLYGAQEEMDVTNGESTTFSVEENEHTAETVAVTDSNAAAVRIDGTLEQVEEGDEFDVSGETLRVDTIIDTGDNGAGVVQFAMGSQQVTLEDGEPVMTGTDEEEVDETYVELSGNNLDSNDATAGEDVELSSVEVAVGAADDDENYLEAGDTFEDPVFSDVEVHFGGLNPEAAEDGEEIDITTDGDDDATVSFTTDGGDSATLNFAHSESSGSETLADSNDNTVNVVEGATVSEDEYQTIEAGDFRHVFQVTDFDEDDGSSAGMSDDTDESVTVSFEDTVTGAEYEADFEADDGDGVEDGDTTDEVIDGQTYTLTLRDQDNGDMTDGTITYGVEFSDGESETDVYSGLETENGAMVHMTGPTAHITATPYAGSSDATSSAPSSATVLNLPTGDAQVWTEDSSDSGGNDELLFVDSNNDGTQDVSISKGSSDDFTVGGVDYVATVSNPGSDTNNATQFTLNVDSDTSGSADKVQAPGVMVTEEDGEDDTQGDYFVSAVHDGSGNDDRIEIGDAATGDSDSEAVAFSTTVDFGNLVTHDDDDDVSSDYSSYGTYVEEDSDEEGSYSFMYPAAQSTAGVAVTGADGDVSAEGAGTVMASQPTGWGDHAALDSDGDVGSLKQNSNLILVGGPAVNNLVSELASDNKTWAGSDYEEGDQVLDLVGDAFTDGQHALVVAGFSGEDTRAAANYIADYADNADELAGQSTLNLATQ